MDSEFGMPVFVVAGKQMRKAVAGEMRRASAVVRRDMPERQSSVQWHLSEEEVAVVEPYHRTLVVVAAAVSGQNRVAAAAAAEGLGLGTDIHCFRPCNRVVAALTVPKRLPKD